MHPIPLKLRKMLEQMPFMHSCQYIDRQGNRCGNAKVEWNHALKYGGRQLQKWYAIIPLCVYHHRGNNGTIFSDVKEFCEFLAISRGIKDLLQVCKKFDWQQRLEYLVDKYAIRL